MGSNCFPTRTKFSQTVTERPRVAQFQAQVTIAPRRKKPQKKKRLPANPCIKGVSAKLRILLNATPTSWPLDCICLYVQVKTYEYESRRLDHRPPIRRCAHFAYWLARRLPGLV